jgi:hypothetical protein
VRPEVSTLIADAERASLHRARFAKFEERVRARLDRKAAPPKEWARLCSGLRVELHPFQMDSVLYVARPPRLPVTVRHQSGRIQLELPEVSETAWRHLEAFVPALGQRTSGPTGGPDSYFPSSRQAAAMEKAGTKEFKYGECLDATCRIVTLRWECASVDDAPSRELLNRIPAAAGVYAIDGCHDAARGGALLYIGKTGAGSSSNVLASRLPESLGRVWWDNTKGSFRLYSECLERADALGHRLRQRADLGDRARSHLRALSPVQQPARPLGNLPRRQRPARAERRQQRDR